MNRYDAIIIGGGLGGLVCGTILSKEGLRVCVLEQQRTVGGCMQSFCREGRMLDTGMHYVGSLSPGQTLHQYFKYLGLIDRIKLRQLDRDGFDVIHLTDGSEYRHALGFEHFADTLAQHFPTERANLEMYCHEIQSVVATIAPEVLRRGLISEGSTDHLGRSAHDTLHNIFHNPVLRTVVAGSISLYGYQRESSSFYEHGMIHGSNIEGAYRFVGCSQYVADELVNLIRGNGGEVRNAAKVTALDVEGGKVNAVEVNGVENIEARHVISSLHPALTLSLLRNNTVIRKAFFTRVQTMSNSFGLFSTYLILKPQSFRYLNCNHFMHNSPDVWSNKAEYRSCNIPVVLMTQQSNDDTYANSITLMTPMSYSTVQSWADTRTGQRGEDYTLFKQRYSEAMIDFVCSFFPELKACIQSVYTASPLTYRDYNASPEGTAYGILTDYRNPLLSHLSARTKIENLYMTGQSLNLHGCLGVTVSAAVASSEILGMEYLSKKIGNA